MFPAWNDGRILEERHGPTLLRAEQSLHQVAEIFAPAYVLAQSEIVMSGDNMQSPGGEDAARDTPSSRLM